MRFDDRSFDQFNADPLSIIKHPYFGHSGEFGKGESDGLGLRLTALNKTHMTPKGCRFD